MSETLTNVVGAIAAVLTTVSWLPQVVKSWRARRATDFSWSHLAMFSSGVALWLAYGVLRSDVVIMAANAVTLLLVVMVMFVKARE